MSQEEYPHAMEEALNSTIDPACLQEPPLAIDVIKQLDVFEVCLYSMLTCMSCLSLLLYLEQCVYIYKNLPYPKKTTIIWVNGAAPVIATMSCFGMWIPRAVMFTDLTSNCYFAVVVYKILVLMIEELGGTNGFLKGFSGKTFKISTGPCCCCCLCLPRVPMSRKLLFWLKLGALQYAILKTVLSVLVVVLWSNGSFDLSDLEITGSAIWINPFIGVLTIISLWPVAIIFMNTNSFLRYLNIIPKYAIYQLILVLSQLQTSIINILALDGTIACAPPFSSQARGSMLSQQMMIMEMFILTLITRFLYRRTYDAPLSEAHDEDKSAMQAAVVEHDV
ncbi:organic solute transporter subunit alpha-like [Pempheris klunzingeri]|uniref:organic solute transporter subunit alpha-like n=1 Tax=Pempheris klunzingeri TaxID=3127111 RepID=UPI00397F6130